MATTHLLKTRGGNQCGRRGRATANIDWVTCLDCLEQHDEICERAEFALFGVDSDDPRYWFTR